VPYEDVRYFYGPLGLYELAGAFRVFGTNFTVAFAFGLAQAAAIFGVFYVLARQWLRPAAAGLATAVLLAIGFSGTAFNFILPHTNSATMGLLFLLLELLAMARGRAWLAGDCARRIDRGGGWYNKPSAVRSALRYAGDDSSRQNNTLGFRVVRELDADQDKAAARQRSDR
jgi:hypothetical protein